MKNAMGAYVLFTYKVRGAETEKSCVMKVNEDCGSAHPEIIPRLAIECDAKVGAPPTFYLGLISSSALLT